jgi:uncharacterized protein YjbI with pentapeptide repeats
MNALPTRPRRVPQIAAALFQLVAFAASARADIFQWEYVNPADPNQGKRQSTTLAPDGAGIDFVRGAELSGRNLTMAYLSGADLFAGATSLFESLFGSNLTGTNLSRADLTNAILAGASLTGADFSDADVVGASFDKTSYVCGGVCISPFPPGHHFYFGTGISLAQLYSTASYQARDLSGIDFTKNELVGGNFAGQNLTNASFYSATLTDANFSEANLTNTGFFLANLTGATQTSPVPRYGGRASQETISEEELESRPPSSISLPAIKPMT